MPSESVLRDQLADNLSLIEQGSTLIAMEFELPNVLGAKGYIDILARDRFPEVLDRSDFSVSSDHSIRYAKRAPKPIPGTLLRFALDYPAKKLERSSGTADLYIMVARLFTEYVIDLIESGQLPDDGNEPVWLASLNAPLVLCWLKSLGDAGRSPTTVNSHRGSLVTLWTAAARKHLAPPVPDHEDLPKRRVPTNCPNSWRPEELVRLLDVCNAIPGRMRNCPALSRRDFWLSLILFLYESGARIGAAMAVTPADVDVEQCLVTLKSITAKTKTEQPIRVSATTLAAIQAILDPQRPKIWPCGKYRHGLYDRLKELLNAAGLPTDRLSKFHRIRRTNATQTALHGSLDMAQRQLGHTSLKMTMKYIELRVLRPVQAVDVVFALPDFSPDAFVTHDRSESAAISRLFSLAGRHVYRIVSKLIVLGVVVGTTSPNTIDRGNYRNSFQECCFRNAALSSPLAT